VYVGIYAVATGNKNQRSDARGGVIKNTITS
jgi:hypothetical protein